MQLTVFSLQLRVNVECAFGMLVQWWGILRHPISASIGLKKTTCLAIALVSLHNFCLKSRMKSGEVPSSPLAASLATDNLAIVLHGGINGDDVLGRPDELWDGGEHFNDISPSQRCIIARAAVRSLDGDVLPREKLLDVVVSKDLKLPLPPSWK
jgi:hypothetical protein